ncbi:conserved hypothetical protein [Leishmania major strain Friedlin]|uniref:Ribosome biogenesis protein NSA1 n=1 Tax=Leishmania major TaxID=5664 RepID=Q4QI35_LEIMA|nr:conserved hypothetical protein [Leishmania major strain Friedlin]CAG9569556.1 hypothetical_protein_-__conserved [Leishmania major strain Friedlin]CAJ02295.1 conserved hypothetical protein [Leishmania major strain Friedlin]|eukprot:XP_001681163.1 conserved hypothetical protein [Leishmania major strain Friedlin]
MTCVTGDDTGVVKIWDISKSSGATLKFSFGEQSRKRAIMGMCWQDSSTSSVAFSSSNGVLSVLDINDYVVSSSVKANTVAGLPNAMSFVKGKLVVVSKDGEASIFSSDLTSSSCFSGNGPIDAVHIHRKFGMVAMGGRENDLCVYDLASDSLEEPVFKARNVRDHILDVPFPVFVTGACIVNPYVFATCTAYHQVRFYDRRSNDRPVQEFEISREIERRPTTMLQWNANKFLIGEASGDVHLYDTRRGFCSRAKLRGGVGSVRCMCKHPAGHQILGVTGLDRKARLYHVPTGKLLMSVYVKQKANCVLLDKQLPMRDRVAVFSGVVNTKQPEKANTLGDALWDDMDPVLDDLDEKAMVADTVAENRRKVQRKE